MKFTMVRVIGKIKDGTTPLMMKMMVVVLNTVGKEYMKKENLQKKLKVNLILIFSF